LSEANQAKIREKVERLPRYFDRISAIDVVVDLQNALAVRVDIQVTAEHTPEFVAHDTAEELIRAVDGAMSKMEMQLRKHKEKVHGHKGQGSDKGNGNIAEPESEEETVEQEQFRPRLVGRARTGDFASGNEQAICVPVPRGEFANNSRARNGYHHTRQVFARRIQHEVQ